MLESDNYRLYIDFLREQGLSSIVQLPQIAVLVPTLPVAAYSLGWHQLWKVLSVVYVGRIWISQQSRLDNKSSCPGYNEELWNLASKSAC